MKVVNKAVVITGGSKGIGKALVLKFAAEGFDIFTCSRKQKDLNLLKKETETLHPEIQIHTFKADLTKKEEVILFSKFVLSFKRQIHVLINNAGIFIPGQIHQEKDAVFEQMMQVNLNAAYYLTKSLLKHIIKQGKGHIFNMCSTASITPYPNGASYCISKYALYGMTKVLREELKPLNIKVTAILPGATFTSSWEGVDLPESRFIPSKDIAESVWACYNLNPNTVVEDLLVRPQLGDIS